MRQNDNLREKQNSGFTLVEVLIAMTILSIIVVPLLNAFVTSAKVNAKSRRILDGNNIAQNYIEEIKSSSVEDVARQFNGYDADAKGYFAERVAKGYIEELYEAKRTGDPADRTTYTYNKIDRDSGASVKGDVAAGGTFVGQDSGEYYFAVKGAKSGEAEYDVMIHLTENDVRNSEVDDGAGNVSYQKSGHEIANINSMDQEDCGYYMQSEDQDQRAAYEFQTRNVAYVYDALAQEDTKWFIEKMERTITVDVSEDVVNVTYTYKAPSTHVANPTYTLTQKIYDSNYNEGPLKAVYLYYYPLKEANSEKIIINNPDNLEKDIYLIRMNKYDEENNALWDNYPEVTVEEPHEANVEPSVNICTNLQRDRFQTVPANVKSYMSTLENKKTTASMYEIEIKVYRRPENAADAFKESYLIETYDASFLDDSQVK